jgi:hypothetical protein
MAQIAHDAIISDTVGSIVKPVEYVRKVFLRMHENREQNPVVRIGTTGTGPYPRYRLIGVTTTGIESVIAAYNDNGTAVLTSQCTDEAWSTNSMNYKEVQDLLSKLRSAST